MEIILTIGALGIVMGLGYVFERVRVANRTINEQ